LFGDQLRDWVTAKLARMRGRRKSLALPAGQVGFRGLPARLVVDDEARVIEWAKTNLPDAVEMVEKLSKSQLKQRFDQTGEIPPEGAHVEPEVESFYIR
jgi:Bacteriophage Mu Gam like protein